MLTGVSFQALIGIAPGLFAQCCPVFFIAGKEGKYILISGQCLFLVVKTAGTAKEENKVRKGLRIQLLKLRNRIRRLIHKPQKLAPNGGILQKGIEKAYRNLGNHICRRHTGHKACTKVHKNALAECRFRAIGANALDLHMTILGRVCHIGNKGNALSQMVGYHAGGHIHHLQSFPGCLCILTGKLKIDGLSLAAQRREDSKQKRLYRSRVIALHQELGILSPAGNVRLFRIIPRGHLGSKIKSTRVGHKHLRIQ